MRTPIIDGRSIDRFIPANLRDMFYRHAMPEYKYAVHDGYAPYGFSTEGLVLYLPLWALKNSSFPSVDAYKHTCAVTGALWTPQGRTFDGDDKITISHHADLNPGSGDFTIAVWIKNSLAALGQIWGKLNDVNYDGTLLACRGHAGGVFQATFRDTNTAGPTVNNRQRYSTIAVNDGKFHLCMASYTFNTLPDIYIDGNLDNGAAVSTGNITSLDAADDLILGENSAGALDYVGEMGEGYAWKRAMGAVEAKYVYNTTKGRHQ